MSRLGSMVVRLALENLAGYKADLDKAAQTTAEGAAKIEQATAQAGNGIIRMGGAMGGAAGTAVEMAGAAGTAGAALGTLAAGAALAGYAAFKGSKEQEAYNQALILTGNISGTTASQMQGMAAGIDAVVGTHYQAAAALTAMASTGQVAGSNLQAFAQVAIQTERVVGTSVADTAKVFAQLGEEPVKASIKLNQSMNYLTAATFEQIKAAQELGDSETAASIAQNAYATAHAARIEKIKEGLGTLEKAWIGVRDFAEKAWDKMLGLGREAGAEQQLAAQRKTVQMLEEQVAKGGLAAGNSQKLLDAARATLDVMGESARLDAKAAQWQASAAQSQKAKIAWMQEGEKYQSKEEQLEGVIAAIRFKGAQAGADELEIEKRIAIEREKAAPKKDNSAARELEKEAALLATLAGVNTDYVAQLERLQRMRDKGTISEEQYLAAINELITKQPMAKKLMDESAKALEKEQKATLTASEAHWKYIESLDKGVKSLQAEVDKQLEHNERLGLSKIAVAELDAAKLELTATEQERQAIRALDKNLDEGEYAMLMKLAKGNRDLAEAKRGGARRETELDTEKEISNERKKGWEETDRLAREVFVNQEISAKRVGDVLGKALKSAVYEATLKPLVFQIYTAATGGGGGGTAGTLSAVGNASSAANGVGVLGSVGSAVGAFGTGVSYGATSLFANGFGATMSAGSQMIGAGSYAAGAGTMVGAVAPYVMAALVVKELMSYKVDAKGNGLTATIGANGLPSGQVGMYSEFQQTGGLGGGGTTINRDWGVADQGVANYITSNVQAITASNKAYGDAIGLTSTRIDGFTKNIEVNITGLDAAGQKAAIDAALVSFSTDQAADAYGTALASVAKDGETTSVTLARLATDLTTVNSTFSALGYTLMDVSVAGAAAASGLVDAFGGLQNFTAQTSAMYSNFYTKDEQKASTVKSIVGTLTGLGINTSESDIAGADRATWRTVLDAFSKDTGTESGSKKYAAVVSAANQLSPYLDGFADPAKVAQPVVSSSAVAASNPVVTDTAMDEWKRGVEAIVQTMTDLRTTMIASGPDKLERLQGQLAIEMAQAKAGSLTALQDLPQLAKLTSSAYAQQHRDSTDQAVFNARLVESLGGVVGLSGSGLGTVKVPSFDVGTDYVPRDMLAMVHEGERITPKAFNPAGGFGGGDQEVARLLREMVARLDEIASATGATSTTSKTTAEVLTNATRGQPLRTKAVT